MSKKMKQFMMALLVIVMSVSILAVPAAAATDAPTAVIPVSVVLNGTQPSTPDDFVIRVEAADASCPVPEGGADGVYETTIQGAGSKDLVFDFDGLGVYSYTITQVGCDNTDCYHDAVSTYHLTVYVVNAEDTTNGRYDVLVSLIPDGASEDDKRDEIIFTNKYADPVEVPLTAKKIYNGKTPKTGLFDFRLWDSKNKVIETVHNVGKNITFTTLVFDKEGTYTYEISEVIGKRPGVIYDESVYTVTITVTRDVENQGDYEATVTYKKNGKPVAAKDLVFINTSKTGGNPMTGDQFRLVLWTSIMAGSLIAVVILLIIWKKRKK